MIDLPRLAVAMCVSGLIGMGFTFRKGRLLLGFLLGAALGPIGWICTAFIHDTRRRCQECLGIINKGARKCVNCGSDLAAA